MKRLMSILFIAILFASCSSDDDNNDSSETTIVGAWTLTEANLAVPFDFNNDGTADPNFKNEIPCFEGDISFTANGGFTQNFSNVETEIVNGETVYVCNGTTTNVGTYELDGTQLTTTVTTPSGPETTTTTIDLDGNILIANIEFGTFGQVELVYQRD